MRLVKLILIFFLFPAALAAIDCAELSRRESFQEAVVVFRGKAIQVQEVQGIVNASGPHLVTFRVDRSWKGPVTETMKVFALGYLPMGDGFRFHEGQKYIVYATKNYPLEKSNEMRNLSEGATVYGIGFSCRLRVVIGSDVDKESRLLGKGSRPIPNPAQKMILVRYVRGGVEQPSDSLRCENLRFFVGGAYIAPLAICAVNKGR